MVLMKVRDQDVIESCGAFGQMTFYVARDPFARLAGWVGVWLGLRQTISCAARIHQKAGSVGQYEERGIAPPGRDLVDLHDARSPRRQCLG